MSQCPICKSKCDSHDYYDDSIHMIIEAYDRCSICGYYHEYAYGYGNEFIGIYKFSYGYQQDYYINEVRVNSNKFNKVYKNKVKRERKRLYRNRILKSRVD